MTYAKLSNFLRHPVVILLSIIMGGALGALAPSVSQSLKPIGEIFVNLLEMSLLPIIFASLGAAFCNLVTVASDINNFKKVLLIYLLSLIGVSIFMTLLTIVVDPSEDVKSATVGALRQIAIDASLVTRDIQEPLKEESARGLMTLILESIPNNIFNSLSEGKTLQIIILSIIFGVAVGYSKGEVRERSKVFLEIVFDVFQRIVMNVAVWLPLAVVALISSQVATVGSGTLMQLGFFVAKVVLCFLLLFITATVIITLTTPFGIFALLKGLKTPLFIAFGTRSGIAAIPAMIVALEEEFDVPTDVAKLLASLGTVLGRFGNIAYTAFCTIFIAGIYQYDLTVLSIFQVIFFSVLAGLSATGTTGILSLGLIAVALAPLQLPLGAVLPILVAVDALIDPIRTLMLVYLNALAIIFIAQFFVIKKTKKVASDTKEHGISRQ